MVGEKLWGGHGFVDEVGARDGLDAIAHSWMGAEYQVPGRSAPDLEVPRAVWAGPHANCTPFVRSLSGMTVVCIEYSITTDDETHGRV